MNKIISNRSTIIGFIGIILGASGLGLGAISIIMVQTQVSVEPDISTQKARVYLNSIQAVAGGAFDLVQFDTKTYDTANNFNILAHMYIVSTTGYYFIKGSIAADISSTQYVRLSIDVNAVRIVTSQGFLSRDNQTHWISDVLSLSEGDLISLSAYFENSVNIIPGENRTYLTICQLN